MASPKFRSATGKNRKNNNNRCGAQVPANIRKRFAKACIYRVLVPFAIAALLWGNCIYHSISLTKTYQAFLASKEPKAICDLMCDLSRVWGSEVTVDDFVLPHTHERTNWKLQAYGGDRVRGLSLFSTSIAVGMEEQGRRFTIFSDSVLCLGEYVFCLHSLTNTTLRSVRTPFLGTNVTQVAEITMPLAVALWNQVDYLGAQEDIFNRSLFSLTSPCSSERAV